MRCEIIKDLLPNYIDDLTSKESNMEIEKHLENCSECREVLEGMKTDITMENIKVNKKKIKPFKKLNQRIIKSVLCAVVICFIAFGSFYVLFIEGYKISSKDIDLTYEYEDNNIVFTFKLNNGKYLDAWGMSDNIDTKIGLKQYMKSNFDHRKDDTDTFRYEIECFDKKGNLTSFVKGTSIIIEFSDKIETYSFDEIITELERDKSLK